MATRTLDVTAIRKDFPIFETGIAYLDSANTSQRPKQVTGAMLDYVDIDERGELRQDQFAALLARGPKLVAFNLVSNALGTINPARDMVAAAKNAGATVLVDGAQSTPHQPVDVRALGCDFYAFSGHKMLGPTGAGILYGRRELL